MPNCGTLESSAAAQIASFLVSESANVEASETWQARGRGETSKETAAENTHDGALWRYKKSSKRKFNNNNGDMQTKKLCWTRCVMSNSIVA